MSMGTELVAFLESLSLGSASASPPTLYRNTVPAIPDVLGVVNEGGGPMPSTGFGEGIQHEMASAQIVFRGIADDSEGPRVKAETAYRACALIQGMSLSGTYYYMVHCLQKPFILKRDDNRRVLWAFNIWADKALSAGL